MSRFLFLDTSGSLGYIALFEKKESIDVLTIDAKEQTKSLLFSIDTLLKTHDLTLTDLSGIAVSIGPGSYTGTRIGLITAKSLSFAKNIPLIALDSFAPYETPKKTTLLLAKRRHVFLKEENKEPTLISYEELKNYSTPIASPDFEGLKPLFPELDIDPATYDLGKIGREIFKKWESKQFSNPAHLNALYLDSP